MNQDHGKLWEKLNTLSDEVNDIDLKVQENHSSIAANTKQITANGVKAEGNKVALLGTFETRGVVNRLEIVEKEHTTRRKYIDLALKIAMTILVGAIMAEKVLPIFRHFIK